jgi:hypothetical protein
MFVVSIFSTPTAVIPSATTIISGFTFLISAAISSTGCLRPPALSLT